MELNDEIVINAPKDRVYAALNDPQVLKQCIPGCEELIKHSDTELEAKVLLKVGPVKARFGGDVVLDQTGAPDAFSLSGQGNGGGAAGHAKGGADVMLTADGDPTLRSESRNRRQTCTIGQPFDSKHRQETSSEVLQILCQRGR